MPWEITPVSELRSAFVHHVLSLRQPVVAACRLFGISRKTAYKWLARYQLDPNAPLLDRSRKPLSSPRSTPPTIEQAVLQVRDQFHWGPRKIHAFLRTQGHADLPSVRTLASILHRHGRSQQPPQAPPADLRFERSRPNELWQCDFKAGSKSNANASIPSPS